MAKHTGPSRGPRRARRAGTRVIAATVLIPLTAVALGDTALAADHPVPAPSADNSRTAVSGPVTHPGADHAGSGMEKRHGDHYASPPALRTRTGPYWLGRTGSAATGSPGPAGTASPAGTSRAPGTASPAGAGTPGQTAHSAAVASTATPLGLDVSSYQGNVNWSSVASGGAQFAYVKATEGTSYTNPYFSQQYNGSRSAGLIRGAYHFALPDRSSGAAQADYFAGHGGGWSADGTTLPGALDIEYNPYGGECYGLSDSAMVAWISSFANEYFTRTARWPVIYSTADWWSTCTGGYQGFASNDPLWVACYCTAPSVAAGWPYETFWQYADSGKFPGDQDLFNGDTAGLERLARGNGQDPYPGVAPGAASPDSGAANLYYTGTDLAVWNQAVPGSGQPASLGGQLTDGPGATWTPPGVLSSSGAMAVFGRGSDDAIWWTAPSASKPWATLGGGFTSKPSAISGGATGPMGELTVFARGNNGSPYYNALTSGGWSGWRQLSGQLYPGTSPAAVSVGGTVYIVMTGTNRELWLNSTTDGTTWSGWRSIGGQTYNPPAITAPTQSSVVVFIRGTNNAAWSDEIDTGTGAAAGWRTLGGNITTAEAATTTPDGSTDLFAQGTDYKIWQLSGTWPALSKWSAAP